MIELKELRELSAQETARHMGLSLAAVKARVFHGRKKLRKLHCSCGTPNFQNGSPIKAQENLLSIWPAR